MAFLCLRAARGSRCRRSFLRHIASPFPVSTESSSVPQAPFLSKVEAQFSSSHFSVRAFCAPHSVVADRSQASPADSHPKAPHPENPEDTEARPTPDDHRKDKEDVPDEKTQVLRAALLHVPKLGWSESAMVAGARDVALSPAIVGVFPRKEAALIEFFMDECLQNLLDYIKSHEDELAATVLQERIAKLVQCRLEMQTPLISRWAQALSIQANPANVPTSFKQRAVLVDEIWHAVGDHSSDVDWYAKRGILAAVYTATELYMLTDHSSGFRDTWSFLQRRVKDVLDCRKTAQEVSQIAQAIGAGLGNSLQGLFKQ